MVCGGIKKETN